MRDLSTPHQGRAVRDVLQSLLVAEAFAPSDPLWLLSGWISDIPIIDNAAGTFIDVDPNWPLGRVHLSQVLRTATRRGGTLRVVLRDVAHNRSFVERLRSIQTNYPDQVGIFLSQEPHEKSLVGKDFELTGSMNFTHSGLGLNDEHLILRTDSASIAARRMTLAFQWDSKFDDQR